MKRQTYFTSNIKRSVVHILVFLTSLKLIMLSARSGELHIVLTCILAFYTHTLLFIPVLLKKKKLKKYLFLTISSIVIIAFITTWFEATRSSIITVRFDGSLSQPSDFYLNKQWIISGLLISFIAFIPFSILSLLYYSLIINKEERKELFSFKYTELIINLIIFSFIFFLMFGQVQKSEYFLVGSFLFLHALTFYLHTFSLMPILMKEQNLIKYLKFIIILFASSLLLITILFHLKLSNTFFFSNFIIFAFFILINLFLSFIYGYVRLKLKNNERLFHIKLGAKESELQLLKSQVNPHFLFNTLNTLYATALSENATKTAESTAKLANLLRYMQNDIHKDFIPLKNEINYLQDYIIIQKLRCALEPEITTTFDNVTNQSISPGLLIPFVENAFKYGIDPSKKSELTISIICDENTIHFTCVNSYNEDFKVHQTEEGFGIGIKNAKQRLDLVYQNKHTFEIIKESNTFSVKLTITSKSL